MIRFIPLLILFLCSSCIQLGGEPQVSRFYLLEPTAEPGDIKTTQAIQLELSPLEFPAYLDRLQIVSRDLNNAIIIAEHDRWAEPLPENLTRTIKENLTILLDGVRISSAPWRSKPEQAFLLKLTINRFGGTIGQQINVDIRWALFSPVDNKELLRKHFIFSLPVGNSYQDFVTGLNRALSKLSEEIATVLAAHAS